MMRVSFLLVGLLPLVGAAGADVAVDSTAVAFELRSALTPAEKGRERLDLSLARSDERLSSSVTARIPFDAQPSVLQIASGHLEWRLPEAKLRATTFFGENRAMLPQNQISLVDLDGAWTDLRGVRLAYDPRIDADSRSRTQGALQVATLPAQQGDALASFWAERSWSGMDHRLVALRAVSGQGESPANLALLTSAWRPRRVGPRISVELGLCTGGGWAAAFEARTIPLYERGGLQLACQPQARWISSDWRNPGTSLRVGRKTLGLEILASRAGAWSRIELFRTADWQSNSWSAGADHRLGFDLSVPVATGVRLRVLASTGRDRDRVVAPEYRVGDLRFARPRVQHDLCVELRAALDSAWARARLMRSWVDRSMVVAMEWGTRLTPSTTAIVQTLAGAQAGEAARTRSLVVLQAAPHERVSLELQMGAMATEAREQMNPLPLFVEPGIERAVRLVMRGAFD